MDKKKAILKGLKSFRRLVSMHTPIQRMIFFGSYAYGKPHKWSDIDLIMVSPDFRGQKGFKRGVDLYKYWTLGYPVDFLCYTPEEFEKLRKQVSIVSQALKEGVEIE